jgi:hypothetical protein
MSVLQARRTVQLAADARSQPNDLLVQRFAIALNGLAADVLAGYEYVIVVADRVKIRSGAEAGDVLIRFEVGVLAAPGVVGIGDAPAAQPGAAPATTRSWLRERPTAKPCARSNGRSAEPGPL